MLGVWGVDVKERHRQVLEAIARDAAEPQVLDKAVMHGSLRRSE